MGIVNGISEWNLLHLMAGSVNTRARADYMALSGPDQETSLIRRHISRHQLSEEVGKRVERGRGVNEN